MECDIQDSGRVSQIPAIAPTQSTPNTVSPALGQKQSSDFPHMFLDFAHLFYSSLNPLCNWTNI